MMTTIYFSHVYNTTYRYCDYLYSLNTIFTLLENIVIVFNSTATTSNVFYDYSLKTRVLHLKNTDVKFVVKY